MIQLTRLNDKPLALNSDLIKLVENAHDTVITLINGEKIVVRESVEQVIERVIEFRRSVLAGLPLSGANLALPVNDKPNDNNDLEEEEGSRG